VGSLNASTLAEQVICEYRVHLEVYSDKPGKGPRRTSAGVDVGELVSLILGTHRSTYRAEVNGIILIARPHAVLTVDGTTVIVRARLGESLKPSLYDRVYLEVAGVAVGVEKALLAFAAARSVEGLREALTRLKSSPGPALGGDWALSTWLFTRDEVLRRLEHLLAYWRGERSPVPRPSPSKCSSCPVAAECPYSASASNASEQFPG
jgi:hypothetical protein